MSVISGLYLSLQIICNVVNCVTQCFEIHGNYTSYIVYNKKYKYVLFPHQLMMNFVDESEVGAVIAPYTNSISNIHPRSPRLFQR